MTDSDSVLLTTREVAALLQVHPKSVYRLKSRGLPAHRLGGAWRFHRDEVLAWAAGTAVAALREPLHSVASPDSSPPPPLLAANGDPVIERLLETCAERAGPLLGLVRADSAGAVELLGQGRVLAAGTHGAEPPTDLSGRRLARVHLVRRTIGLAGQRGRAAPTLDELIESPRKFATRPPSAGIRLQFEAALSRRGGDTSVVHARARTLGGHGEVAMALARGDVKVGLLTRAWADRLDLPFTAIGEEDYGLLIHADHLGTPVAVALVQAAQSEALRIRLGEIAGYDPTRCGEIVFDTSGVNSSRIV